MGKSGHYYHRLLFPLIVAVSFAAISRAAHGEETLVVGIRGNHEATDEYVVKFPSRSLLKSDTLEFPNGNTFVRLIGDSVGRAVEVLLPGHFTPDTLMEALIKIRTAKSSGARDVSVVLPPGALLTVAGFPDMTRNTLFSWFAIAGAARVLDHVDVSTPLWARGREFSNRLPTPSQTIVLSKYHDSFGEAFASALGVPVMHGDASLLLPKALKGTQIFLVAPAVLPVNESFFRTLEEIRALKGRGATVVLVTPYLPYARSDKKDQPGVTITGRFTVDLLESAGIDAVSFAPRAHAPQSEGFFSVPVFHVSGRATINQFLREQKIELVISPDAGFQKDATRYADDLGVDVVVLNKQRDPSTGKARLIEMSGVRLEGRIVAIIDDETASGGTLAMAAEFLKKRGASRAIAVVTHLTGDAKAALESGFVDELAVTDSLPTPMASPKLRILSVAAEMAAELKSLTSGVCAQTLGGS